MAPMPQKIFSDYGKDAAFLMSEAPGRISREQAVIGPLTARTPGGTVLGQITATGVYVPLAPAANDGSQVAAAILMLGQKVNTGPTRAAIVARQCEVADRMLFFPTGITENQKKAAVAQLATKTILVRA